MAFDRLHTSQERRICVQQALDNPRRELLISGYLRKFEHNETHLSTDIPSEIRLMIIIYHLFRKKVAPSNVHSGEHLLSNVSTLCQMFTRVHICCQMCTRC